MALNPFQGKRIRNQSAFRTTLDLLIILNRYSCLTVENLSPISPFFSVANTSLAFLLTRHSLRQCTVSSAGQLRFMVQNSLSPLRPFGSSSHDIHLVSALQMWCEYSRDCYLENAVHSPNCPKQPLSHCFDPSYNYT